LETIEIQVEPRETKSKGAAKRVRRLGKIPGIFYGPKAETVPFQINSKDFVARVAGIEGSHLIRIKSDTTSLADRVALVKEMQFHPVSGQILHVDFYEVDLKAKIRVKVPLHFTGKAVGVVRGGILQPIVREVEVECLPLDIPEYLDIEVSSLDIGHSLQITDLPIPEGVTAIYEDSFPVVSVVPPTVEKEAVAEAAPVVEGAEAAPAAAVEEKKEEKD
jgi:large subunit ribosomal protein L25